MPPPAPSRPLRQPPAASKGERTERAHPGCRGVPLRRSRLRRGTTLREIARARRPSASPGLYNHFASKRDLYAAVLDRGLSPLAAAMTESMEGARTNRALRDLAGVITDRLLEHPQMAALFQQALQGGDGPGQELIRDWLDRLLAQGMDTARSTTRGPVDRAELAIQILAMFNVTTGYFLSQRILDTLGVGSLDDPANVARQKALLDRMARGIARR